MLIARPAIFAGFVFWAVFLCHGAAGLRVGERKNGEISANAV
ncbi:hypothetical protein [Ruegeria arenilitoris]|nr:hypothetical protein [Ruegeria arenilitoris]